MLIRFLLIASTLTIAWYFLTSRGTSRSNAFKKVLLVGFVAAAIVAILIPEALTQLANFVGVGRGTDLLVYVLVQVVAFQMFNTYAKDKQNQRQIVHLARRIAILESMTATAPAAISGGATPADGEQKH
ncbi:MULTISPECIES: DUF2304 domain-containing protein [Stenotrophomonas maltophilia group]|jgi:hypothetical protein|uniref:DUF2304 domain-containing protein n=1 Tax=Stenotrophomonas maltophilia TaxID=40324 RepID=A0A246I8T1_STEMA|nr:MULTISPECIES: DUF2304 domain-containing protein [Stenotrophomonas maltophilia group]CRR78359.1 hypothetical protein PAERUG_E15_London_28_01_14_10828 [Pseudomonas aeruginosa]MBA0228214.1 DUF2304 domain-containing protein [Stenotrophomonas maltophilia]MBA0367690.1 DUF2304 domain-containing protein [Stenotrophomonas maltophilia]MBA0401862.1 DUF2304 domain-containing protein [Stenotrophomonas maltophilia]MBA0405789.1 DUF2304 domain-containing protein [Stenotrophomonas maltophilia]